MFDVGLVRAPDFAGKFREAEMIVLAIAVETGVEIAVAITEFPSMIGPASPSRDLDMFCSAHQPAPEQAIDIINGGDGFTSCHGHKARPLMCLGRSENGA